MQLTKQQLRKIIEGSTILGTGGGGRYDSALSTIKNLAAVELINYEDLQPNDIVITAYGAGGLTKPKSTEEAMSRGLKLLQEQVGQPIKAIVPVEIGPYSLAAAFEIASKLGVPVVDGDLVGFRSVPEIFIELVTLADLGRCPLVFGNNEGDTLLLDTVSSAERLEEIVRTFANGSKSNTFVLGYPYTKVQLNSCLAKGSVSYCQSLMEELPPEFHLIGRGTVGKDSKQEVDGFTKGYLTIQDDGSVYRIEFKNEYLVLLKNREVVLTCPDLICVIDQKTGLGLNNGDDNTGQEVLIYVKPAVEQWLTKEGLALFSPRKLGLNYSQKVLE